MSGTWTTFPDVNVAGLPTLSVRQAVAVARAVRELVSSPLPLSVTGCQPFHEPHVEPTSEAESRSSDAGEPESTSSPRSCDVDRYSCMGPSFM